MAVSPIVNSFMQDSEAGQGPVSAEQIFKNQFSDMAFNALRAKFPALINQVVTLKHMANDVEKGSAFGVFVIQSGNDLVYIPAAMADGSIVSCEMMYDKDADQFYPLDTHTVKEILAKSRASDPVILQNNPRVEDTRRLFHNMIRPPSSSNVVLAGNRGGIMEMPETARSALAKYLSEDNPQLLGKLASFYPPEELAFKLAHRHNQETAANASATFIRMDKLTKDAAERLDAEEKKEILENGWLVKNADDAPVLVTAIENLNPVIEKELRLTLYTPPGKLSHANPVPPERAGSGLLLQAGKDGISFPSVIVCGHHIYAGDGTSLYLDDTGGALISDLTFEDCNLLRFPCVVTLSRLRELLADKGHLVVEVFVPGRAGTRRRLPVNVFGDLRENIDITDDRVKWPCGSIQVSPRISAGYITVGGNSFIVPLDTLFLVTNNSKCLLSPIVSWKQLEKIMGIFGVSIKRSDNGAGINITANEKTASFASLVDAAEWLHGQYGMDANQIKTVLNNDKTLVFEKSAYLDPTPDMLGQPEQMPAAQMDDPMQAEEMAAIPESPQFDALEDFAALEDPEMFDTGILASFAQYPDAKQLLVEYMPDFLAAEDKIGRVLLLFCSQKKEIEAFYGTEKCSTLIASLRRIFSILGELVASLKLYVNMV